MNKLIRTELSGNGYDLGVEFAKLFPNHNKNIFAEFSDVLGSSPEALKRINILKEKLQKFYPLYYNEMCGRADGFGVDIDAFIMNISCQTFSSQSFYSSRFAAAEKESCSDIIVKTPKGIIAGHNEDLGDDLNQLALIKYVNGDGSWFYDMSSCNCPQGTTFGWNSHGLSYSVNSIATDDINATGIPVWFLLRDIVNCSNLEEVTQKIGKNDCASALNLNVCDIKNNKAYNIERCFDKVDVLEVTDRYVHTNHLIHAGIEYRNKENSFSTTERFELCTKLLSQLDTNFCSADDLLKILQRNNGENDFVQRLIGAEKYPTVATFLIDAVQKEIKIYSYYDNSCYQYNIVI